MVWFFERKGTKAFSPWLRAPYEENVNLYWSISRAPNRLRCLQEIPGLQLYLGHLKFPTSTPENLNK